MNALDILLGIARFISKRIGAYKKWSEWAVREPAAAAQQLIMIAGQLQAAAMARSRKRNGKMRYLPRRKMLAANRLLAQARELMARANSGCPAGCDCRKPGT